MAYSCDFKELGWNRERIRIPSNKTIFRLAHLRITPLPDDEVNPDVKVYRIERTRTNEVICLVKVHPEDEENFHLLQKYVLTSRLMASN